MKTTLLTRFMAILISLAMTLSAPMALAQEQSDDGPFYAIDALESLGFELEEHEGKVIVINFFTTWCGYCVQEMPDFKKAFEDYSKDELEMILVHVCDGETSDVTAAFVEKHGLEDMTIVEDEDFAKAGGVGVPGYPTTLIIDKEGYLSKAIAQAMSYDALSGYLDSLGVAKAEAPAL